MKIRLFCACILLFGCVKRVNVAGPSDTPIYGPDRTWAQFVNVKGFDWTVISKTGPHDKEVCPHGVICDVEVVGTMYRIRRK